MRLRTAAMLGLALIFVCAPRPASAKEQVFRFVEVLNRMEMYDVSVMYLDSLGQRPRIPAEITRTLYLEQGLANMNFARASKDPVRRERHLEIARDKFRAFLVTQPGHVRSPFARTRLGSVLVEQAKTNLARSKQPSRAGDRERLVQDARLAFAEADQQVLKACEELEEQLKLGR